MAETIRIGSRGSQLALWQARHLQQRLEGLRVTAEIEVIHTSGDKILDVPLAAIGGKGLFTKEIEEALYDGRVDVAIHSLKDVPAQLPPGLLLAAILEREDPRDVLVARAAASLATLPAGARVGTSSLRRQAQLLRLRPDLTVLSLRGNVDTRLRKLNEGQYDAIILAAAGLRRLDRTDGVQQWIAVEEMCPAVGQGALALECREEDTALRELLLKLHHPPTAAAVEAERALLRTLEAGCQAPIAGHATGEPGRLHLRTLVAMPDGTNAVTVQGRQQPGEAAEQFGRRIAQQMLAAGAGDVLAQATAAAQENA